MPNTRHFASNRLLATFTPSDRQLIEASAAIVELRRGEVLFEPGSDVPATHFPSEGTVVALVVGISDGRTVEVATIGKEGAVGGIVSGGHAPAYARAVVQIPGAALKVELRALEQAKLRSPHIRELFARYSDALLAQVMQSVACNAFHPLEARCCRWLLTAQDRAGGETIPLTQEYLAEMLGVQRTTVSAVASALQEQGLIAYRRGAITVLDRVGVEGRACECYSAVERHFRDVLPEVRPQKILDAGNGGS
ncbi:MAG TPA: Crp/Fnr family transcriptional regulator [Allosphingosinicella sp.]